MSKEIHLKSFEPREYQLALFDAIENKGYRRGLFIWPRRAGKDFCAFALCVRAALKRPQTIYYVLPTFASGRRILWDATANDGSRIIDYAPKELCTRNEQQMRIQFANGSVFQIVGSLDYNNSIVGTNPKLVVFSEYSLQDPNAFLLAASPILNANDGTAVFLSTPRGKNHLWDLYQIASNSNDWYVSKLTLDETQHVPLGLIEKEVAQGLISQDLVLQEYYTSFDMGVEGAYYTKYIDKLRLNGQIGVVRWEPNFPVHTSWDLGFNDPTSIIFFQIIGQTIRIIDCYENSKQGLEHYAKIINQKPYTYGRHIGPHDIAVHSLSTGISRWNTMRDLGIKFVMPKDTQMPHLIEDGIEAVRRNLPKMWFDEKACAPLLKALENYRQDYDEKKRIYASKPRHDWASHFSDAMRYLCGSLGSLAPSTTPEELDRRYREAYYGPDDSNMPSVFRNEVKGY